MQREAVEESLSSFVKAEELDPENSDVYHHHGQVSFMLVMLCACHFILFFFFVCAVHFVISNHISRCYFPVTIGQLVQILISKPFLFSSFAPNFPVIIRLFSQKDISK